MAEMGLALSVSKGIRWTRSSRFVMIKEEREKEKKKKHPAGDTGNPDCACAGSPDYFYRF